MTVNHPPTGWVFCVVCGQGVMMMVGAGEEVVRCPTCRAVVHDRVVETLEGRVEVRDVRGDVDNDLANALRQARRLDKGRRARARGRIGNGLPESLWRRGVRNVEVRGEVL